MQVMIRFLLGLFVILLSPAAINAKDWRTIIPLHSTKDDVTRLLGPPAEENEIRSIYQLDTEDIYIVFSGEWSYQKCVTDLPAGTVLLIQIRPRLELSLSDVQTDRQKLIEFDPSDPPDIGYRGYIDEEQGIVIRTLKGRIEEISYIAARVDRKLCSEYYEEPKKFASIIVDFRGQNKRDNVDTGDRKEHEQKKSRKP